MAETAPPPAESATARPLVSRPVNNRAAWLFAAAAGLAATALFASLEARRSQRALP